MDSSIHLFDVVRSLPTPSSLRPEAVYAQVNTAEGSKKRRCWTEAEDLALRHAVSIEHPDGRAPSKWLEIARHVPGRTNKDCRKRWHNHMACPRSSKGGWSAEEDALLIEAVRKYGTKWPSVSAVVGTRKSCQCARRWYDTLDPKIDKTAWTSEEDSELIAAVNKHGKRWSFIAKTYFPRRTGLAAKNRFFSIVTSSMRRNKMKTESEKDETEDWLSLHDTRISVSSTDNQFTYDTDSNSSSSPSSPSLTTRSTSSPTSDADSPSNSSFPYIMDSHFDMDSMKLEPQFTFRNIPTSPIQCAPFQISTMSMSMSFPEFEDARTSGIDQWNAYSGFSFQN